MWNAIKRVLPIVCTPFLLLSACSVNNEQQMEKSTPIENPGTETAVASMPESETTQTPSAVPLPLSEAGPYNVGIRRNITFIDPDRDGREVSITIWYPAVVNEEKNKIENPDAEPDMSAAPYPLILSSSKVGFTFAPHLVSYGFTWVGVNRIDSYATWDNNLIDQPLDILFALDQVASTDKEGLEGIINTNQVGSIGYSFDAFNALAVSGARVDPQAYLERCASANDMDPVPPEWWIHYICDLSVRWDAFSAYAGSAITTSEDGLWRAMTDERIKAVMPMAPEGAWLFAERGLAAADRPVLIIGAEKDDINIYDLEAAFIFDHLGATDKFMITFLGKDHMMVYDAEDVEHMSHFTTAFFGYYLKGREDYKQYFSEEFVTSKKDFEWGAGLGN